MPKAWGRHRFTRFPPELGDQETREIRYRMHGAIETTIVSLDPMLNGALMIRHDATLRTPPARCRLVAAGPWKLLALAAVFALVPVPALPEDSLQTRIGELRFTHGFGPGYPTDETVSRLFEEIDFQRACQAYLWAIPLVSTAQWQYSQANQLGAENGQIVFVESYQDKLGGLTYNVTTPYAIAFIDLTEGPWVIVMPEGEVRGAASDMWQVGIAQMTKPGRYLFVGPGQNISAGASADGYTVYQTPTNNILLGIRLMPRDRKARMALLEQVQIYPYAERARPRPRGYLTPKSRTISAAHPRGIEYWERLADIVDREPVAERNRLLMAMLAPLGIEKGKPFAPDTRQQRILEEAVVVGEAMAKALDFDKSRLADAAYVEGSHWDVDTTCPPDQRRAYYDDLDGCAAWFYEAVTNDIGMHGMKTGKGQVYLTAYKDADGDWLDGGRNYLLKVPPDVPAEAFWSLTLYEVDTRDIIHNDRQIADRSSRHSLHIDTDGSIPLRFGPDKPDAPLEANWIPTEKGRAFFAMFRVYSPAEPLIDRSWVLPDIAKAASR